MIDIILCSAISFKNWNYLLYFPIVSSIMQKLQSAFARTFCSVNNKVYVESRIVTIRFTFVVS